MAREDFRQRITNALINNIEAAGGLPWHNAWPQMEVRPFNPGTGEKYKGGNVLNLMLEQVRRGSSDPRWMTLAQANDAGLRIRKNAKAAYVEYWDFEWNSKDSAKPESGGKPDYGRRQGRVLYAPLFNGADIVGIPEYKRAAPWNSNELAEQLISASGAAIREVETSSVGLGLVENMAYFSPSRSTIVVPPKSTFAKEDDYYATVLHQLAKWTGQPSMLNRTMPGEGEHFSSPTHAREELRAEIATVFMTSMLGVQGTAQQNHAIYSSSWASLLRTDKHEVFRAAKDAEKIVEFLFSFDPELRLKVEKQMLDAALPGALVAANDNDPETAPPTLNLPEFSTEQVDQVARGIGRNDPRWIAFEATLKAEAEKVGVSAEVANSAMAMVEPQFSDVMDAATKNGYTHAEMCDMLARSIIDEMQAADERHQQWQKLCSQVHEAGRGLHPPERIELALQELGVQYQTVIAESVNENWNREETDKAIHAVIFGEKGRRAIRPEYVQDLLHRTQAGDLKPVPTTDTHDPDEIVLEPIGLAELEESSEKHLMADATMQENDGP